MQCIWVGKCYSILLSGTGICIIGTSVLSNLKCILGRSNTKTEGRVSQPHISTDGDIVNTFVLRVFLVTEHHSSVLSKSSSAASKEGSNSQLKHSQEALGNAVRSLLGFSQGCSSKKQRWREGKKEENIPHDTGSQIKSSLFYSGLPSN